MSIMHEQPSSLRGGEKMYPANRVNRLPEWEDYREAARKMKALGLDADESSLEEVQQILADAQAHCGRG